MNEKQMIDRDEMEIDLLELFHVLLERWKIILLTAIIGAALAFGMTKFLVTPMYQSQAMLYILASTNESGVTSMTELQIGATVTGDIKILATTKAVIEEARKEIERQYAEEFTNGQISQMVTVSSESNTRILTIKAEAADPELACIVADAVAEATAERAALIMGSEKPSMLAEAEVPLNPSSPSLTKNIAIGMLAGIMLSCGIILVQYLLNDNIKTAEDVEKYLGESTLVLIPYVKNKGSKKEELERMKAASSKSKSSAPSKSAPAARPAKPANVAKPAVKPVADKTVVEKKDNK